MYTVRYFRLYGGPKGDSRLLRGYVVLCLFLALNFAAANTAVRRLSFLSSSLTCIRCSS